MSDQARESDKPPSTRAALLMGVVVAVLGVSLTVTMLTVVGARPSPLPIAAQHLPVRTHSVARSELAFALAIRDRMRREDVPAQALWARLSAVICGGDDLYDMLFHGRDADAARMLAKPGDQLAAPFACGRSVADELGARASLYPVRFAYDAADEEVTLLTFDEPLPATTTRQRKVDDPLHLTTTRCFVDWEAARLGECPADAPAAGRLASEGAWVVGKLTDVRSFGRASHPTKVPRAAVRRGMERLSNELADYPFVLVGDPKHYLNHLTVALNPGVSVNGEPEERALATAIGAGAEAWAVGQRGDVGAAEVRLILFAAGRKEAADLRDAVEAFVEFVRVRVAGRVKAMGDAPRPDPDYDSVARDGARRAFEAASARVEGTRVELVLTTSEASRGPLDEELDRGREHAKRVAAVIGQVVAGRRVPREMLEAVGGDGLVEAVEERRAVAEGSWPFDPEPWKEVQGFFVPGRGAYGTEYLGTDSVFVFTYPMGRALLRQVFQAVAQGKGWKVEKASTRNTFEAINGGKRVGVLVGGDREGESALVLFVRSR
jgi:hypothetical protein